MSPVLRAIDVLLFGCLAQGHAARMGQSWDLKSSSPPALVTPGSSHFFCMNEVGGNTNYWNMGWAHTQELGSFMERLLFEECAFVPSTDHLPSLSALRDLRPQPNEPGDLWKTALETSERLPRNLLCPHCGRTASASSDSLSIAA